MRACSRVGKFCWRGGRFKCARGWYTWAAGAAYVRAMDGMRGHGQGHGRPREKKYVSTYGMAYMRARNVFV